MPKGGKRFLCFCLALASSGLACVKTRVDATPTTVSSGSALRAAFSIDGETHQLDVCRSGDREYFLGVDLEDSVKPALLRLLIDPLDGPRVRVREGGGSGRDVTLDAGSCRQLEADVHPTGWRVNRVRDFSGHLEAECTSASGREVRAHVSFTHCH